ncbi:MAG: carbonic anhydrase family protein [Treponema sp.]|nr:carbonic anhydrase family protein [Treponema sp.]
MKIKKRAFLPLVAVLLLFQSTCAGTAVRKEQAALPVTLPATLPAEGRHWSYTGDTGSGYWHSLDPAWAIAKDGRAQSPVNIPAAALAPSDTMERPEFYYHATRFEIENNGHTIELTPLEADNYIIIDNGKYTLQQMHFHLPGEHTVDGKRFAMEAHLVHKNPEGAIVVIGILISGGKENPVLKETFSKLPEEITLRENSAEPAELLDLADLLPLEKGLYRYEGSLTTPPCTEGVKWAVFARPVELSDSQIKAFAAVYSGNNRPVQPLYERKVYLTD